MDKPSILLVDDNAGNLDRLAKELDADFAAVRCSSGREAIEAARRHDGGFRYAAVDFKLEKSGMDGLATTRQLADLSQRTFVLLYSNVLVETAEQASERRFSAYDAGAHRFLQRTPGQAALQVRQFTAEMDQLEAVRRRVASFYEERRQIPSVLSLLDLGVDIVDRAQKVWFVNDAFRRIAGLSAGVLPRRPCFDWHGYKCGPCPGCFVCQTLAGESPKEGRVYLLPFPRRGPGLFYVHTWGQLLTDEQGKPLVDTMNRPLAATETVEDLSGSGQLARMALTERLGHVARAIHERRRPGFGGEQPFQRVAIYALDENATSGGLTLAAAGGYEESAPALGPVLNREAVPEYDQVVENARQQEVGTYQKGRQPDPLRHTDQWGNWIYWPILNQAGAPTAFLRVAGALLDGRDLDTLKLYADEVARAMKEQRRQQAAVVSNLDQQTAELELIDRQLALKAGDPLAVLRLLVTEACRLTGAYTGHVRERLEKDAVLVRLAPHEHDEYERQAVDTWPLTHLSSWSARTILSSAEQVVNDIAPRRADLDIDRQVLTDQARAVVTKAQSICFLPFVFEGRCLGALGLHHLGKDAFTEEKLWLLRQLVRRATMALRDLRLLREHRELDQERRHHSLSNAVGALLAEHEFDMRAIVDGTAKAIVEVGGYYRVLLCMVNGKCTRIQAVASHCADPTMDIKAHTDFRTDFAVDFSSNAPLPDTDIQAWVCATGKACRVDDAADPNRKGPATQAAHANALGMKATCVLPTLYRDQVTGTLQVERMDKGWVDDGELELLQSLANRIAIVFHQAERVTLLDTALRDIENRVRIIDPNDAVLFLNRPHGALPAGWQDDPRQCKDTCVFDWDRFCRLRDPMKDGATNRVRHYVLTAEQGTPKAYDWELTHIRDFRRDLPPPFAGADAAIGFIESALDLTEVYALSTRLRSWLECRGVLATADAILAYFRDELKFRWARIYVVKRDDRGTALQSLAEYGLQRLENQVRFREGRIVFPSTGQDSQPWYVINNRVPLAVFRVVQSVPALAVIAQEDWQGVPCLGVSNSQYRDELEKPDATWFEAPLLVGPEAIGKVTISLEGKVEGPNRMLPSDFELLKTQALGAAVALSAALHAEAEAKRSREEAWQTAAQMAVHQLSNKLRGADGLQLVEWALAANDLAAAKRELPGVRTQVASALAIIADLRRYAENTSFPDDIVRSVADLVPTVIDQLRHEHRDVAIGLSGVVPAAQVRTSETIIKEVLDILIQNSLKHAGLSRGDLRITITVETPDSATSGVRNLVLRIRDNGRGVSPELKRRIFDPFFTTAADGTGLGLAIAARHVHRLRGEIREEGQAGLGACFSVHLPLFR